MSNAVNKVKTDLKTRYDRVVAEFDAILDGFREKYEVLHDELDALMSKLESDVMVEEVLDLAPCPVAPGDRVWCAAHKRLGTVESVDLVSNGFLVTDDYYAPKRGPESYEIASPWSLKHGNGQMGRYSWRIVVNTDPSAKAGSMASFVWNRKAEPTWVAAAPPLPERYSNKSTDPFSEHKVVDSFQEHEGVTYIRAQNHGTP